MRHLRYRSIEAWMQGEHVPLGFFSIPEEAAPGRFVDQFCELQQHLFQNHLRTLTPEERQQIRDGLHPSQSHRFAAAAEPIVAALRSELSHLAYVRTVGLKCAQLELLQIDVEVDPNTSLAQFEAIPWFYRGYRVNKVCRPLED